MNCREAQDHLFSADSALDPTQRAALATHVAQCAECGRIQNRLTAALTTWREQTAGAAVPDAQREWHVLRRKIRGGVNVGDTVETTPARRSLFGWITLPLGAAAAIALAFLVARQPPSGLPAVSAAQIARADFVEAPDKASTLVYVDEKSGWLFVVASDTAPQSGD